MVDEDIIQNIREGADGKVIGFTCGPFDLCHAGHVLMFEDCKNHCDVLVVGFHIDPSIENPNKNPPVQSSEERLIQLRAIKHIDRIIPYHTQGELKELLAQLKPHVRIRGDDHIDPPFVTGTPYKTVYHKRSGYSSSELRKRVHDAEKKKQEQV